MNQSPKPLQEQIRKQIRAQHGADPNVLFLCDSPALESYVLSLEQSLWAATKQPTRVFTILEEVWDRPDDAGRIPPVSRRVVLKRSKHEAWSWVYDEHPSYPRPVSFENHVDATFFREDTDVYHYMVNEQFV